MLNLLPDTDVSANVSLPTMVRAFSAVILPASMQFVMSSDMAFRRCADTKKKGVEITLKQRPKIVGSWDIWTFVSALSRSLNLNPKYLRAYISISHHLFTCGFKTQVLRSSM